MCEAMVAQGWVVEEGGRDYALTAAGRDGLAQMGVPAEALRARAGRRQLYGCVDWSERRDHFAGPLAVALLDNFIERGWLRRNSDSRALKVPASGKLALAELFGAAGS